MIRALYTTTSGSMALGSDRFDTLAHNIVNANTPGFRAQYIKLLSKGGEMDTGIADTTVLTSEYFEDKKPGVLEYTGESLDVDTEGDTYLTVELGDGSTGYTRNGRMRMRPDGQLTDALGNLVLGRNGPIKINPGTAKLNINEKGEINADGRNHGVLKIVSFDEKVVLKPIGGGVYVAPLDAEAKEAESPGVTQGYYERSNVNPVEEMVRMLSAVRSLEGYGKMSNAITDDTTAAVIRQTGKVERG